MDKNTLIGLTLIFGLLLGWQQFMAPTEEQLAEAQRQQDSIALLEQQENLEVDTPATIVNEVVELATDTTLSAQALDSLQNVQLAGVFGQFAPAGAGQEKMITLENDLLKVTLSSKGGKVVKAELKEYKKAIYDEEDNQTKVDLFLLEDKKDKFGYFFPIANIAKGGVHTEDLYFDVVQEAKDKVVFRARTSSGGYFEQRYALPTGNYILDYDIEFNNLQNAVAANTDAVQLQWVNYLDKIERSVRFEQMYSTLQFKETEDGIDQLSWNGDDNEDIEEPLKWVAHSNQFFSSILMADSQFEDGKLDVKVMADEDEDLKKLTSTLAIPFQNGSFSMDFYVGPNEFERLEEMGHELHHVIPYGASILGTINRWVFRPIFNFLSGAIGSMGIAILLLTFLVKLVLYPLTYKMLHSQSMMAALKPRIEKLKEKNGDDQQAQQMATMKLYQEYGVNPLGGCMPMLLQMPIWIALFRFFPAAIEFRQKSFLWAQDLSSYDAFFRLPFDELPLVGNHISLFTLLWAVSTILYTYYNSKHMDMSANPAMKYMQYFMPLMFLGYFNSYASGLTAYYFFSNVFNVTQTLVTKNFIIDQDKLEAKLQANKSNPKKKSGFRQRLEAAMEEQRRLQEQQEKNKK